MILRTVQHLRVSEHKGCLQPPAEGAVPLPCQRTSESTQSVQPALGPLLKPQPLNYSVCFWRSRMTLGPRAASSRRRKLEASVIPRPRYKHDGKLRGSRRTHTLGMLSSDFQRKWAAIKGSRTLKRNLNPGKLDLHQIHLNTEGFKDMYVHMSVNIFAFDDYILAHIIIK